MNRRPNIVFMIADDHRFDGIHACGNPIVHTPVLDGLIASGTAFRKSRIMGGLIGGVCVPSRAAIHTGVNVLDASVSRTIDDAPGLQTLKPEHKLLAQTLRESGYYTHAVGKWHNDKASFHRSFSGGAKLFFRGMSDHLKAPVFDFDPDGVYPQEKQYIGEKFSTELFSDEAVQFLQQYPDDEKPFFLYVAFTSPHDPRMPPKPYADMYDPDRMPLPDNYAEEHPFDNGEMANRDESLAPWPRTPDIVRRHTAEYYGMISHMDAQIGRILAALQERGDADNTIVVYTADHGVAIGRHGLMGKQNLYEHSICVPLIIRGPGIPASQWCDALVYTYDVYPTLCELTDTTIPPTVESQSLLPLIRGEKESSRDTVCTLYKDVQRMVTDGEWKLIRYYRSLARNKGTDALQLFHLAADPQETRNLAQEPEQRERMERLAGKLAEWQRKVNDPLAGRPILMD